MMQISAVAVIDARNNLWAEERHTQLRRSLGRQLARRMLEVRVLDQGDPYPPPGDLRRLGTGGSTFQSRHDGFSVVGGQWRVRDGDDRLLAACQCPVEYPLAADGHQAVVKSLIPAWRSVAVELAPAVKRSWPP